MDYAAGGQSSVIKAAELVGNTTADSQGRRSLPPHIFSFIQFIQCHTDHSICTEPTSKQSLLKRKASIAWAKLLFVSFLYLLNPINAKFDFNVIFFWRKTASCAEARQTLPYLRGTENSTLLSPSTLYSKVKRGSSLSNCGLIQMCCLF